MPVTLDFSKAQMLDGPPPAGEVEPGASPVALDFSRAQPLDLTANPNGEGLYKMASPDGRVLPIPFSNVPTAQQSGFKLWGQDDATRYQKDFAATLPGLQKMQSNFDFGTRRVASDGSDTSGSRIEAGLQNFGHGAGDLARGVEGIVTHPWDAAGGLVKTAANVLNPLRVGPPKFVTDAVTDFANDPDKLAAAESAAGNLGANVVLGEAGGVALKGLGKVAGKVSTVAGDTGARLLTAGNLDETIPGDTVTPREQYQAAQGQGVNLDLAQATGSTAAKILKRPVEHSLGGSPLFERLQAANREALNTHASAVLDDIAPSVSRQELVNQIEEGVDTHQDALNERTQEILDDIAPQMPRQQFGSMAKESLLSHMQAMNEGAGKVFDDLTAKGDTYKPNVSGVRELARQIIADNQSFYAKLPELKKGGVSSAWSIVRNLAQVDDDGMPLKGASSRFTWTDLHKLRSSLMDLYRSPEIVGSHAEGWLKELTGAVDQAMTRPASGLAPGELEQFRSANALYAQMKNLFDNPQSTLFHVVRAPDGLQAANLLARIQPTVAAYIEKSVPNLMPQLQRQMMERILSPAGNAAPEWDTLPGRFGRAQKEAMAGVLSPDHVRWLDMAARGANELKEYGRNLRGDTAVRGFDPAQAAYFARVFPELKAQLQRQTMERVLSPAGNAVPEWGTLPTRFSRTQKETLGGILSPQQMKSLEDMARTSRIVNMDSNPSGSGKVGQATQEGRALVAGPFAGVSAAAVGHPVLGAAMAAAPYAEYGATRAAAKFLTNPETVQRVMTTSAKGPAGWVARGAQNLTSAGVDQATIDELGKTAAGKQVLMNAGDVKPGTTAMKAILAGIVARGKKKQAGE